jgi:hypothetical protein
MQIEFDYELDHYGLDNWQAEWGNGDIERNIVVMYNTLLPDTRYEQVDFDYQVLMDGVDITASLSNANKKAFESLMHKEHYDRKY